MGGIGKRLGAGFCTTLYQRISGLSLDAARRMAHDVMAFAQKRGTKALVVENLKG